MYLPDTVPLLHVGYPSQRGAWQDLGWADVSFNRASPDPEIVTPNLQKLVDEGVHLTRHYVHSPHVHPPLFPLRR